MRMKVNVELVPGRFIEVPIELDAALVKQVMLEFGFEDNESYYSIDFDGDIKEVSDCDLHALVPSFYSGTLFNSFEDAQFAQTAMRIRREIYMAAKYDNNICVNEPDVGQYTIGFNYETKELEVGVTGRWASFGEFGFNSEAAAWETVEKYRDDLTWYFEEYIPVMRKKGEYAF